MLSLSSLPSAAKQHSPPRHVLSRDELLGDGGDAEPMPAPFLTKTYQLVDDATTDHIVSWGDGRVSSSFVVWRPPEFARDILPNYFKHNNFSSFVRQLNTYGFRKVVPERWEFANDLFRKGDKQLLSEMHRRKTASSSLPFPPTSPPLFRLYHQPHLDEHLVGASHWHANVPSPRLLVLGDNSAASKGRSGGAATAAELLEENNSLRRSNSALLSELAHMRQLYNDIIYFMQNHVRPVAPSSVAAASASFLLSAAAACNQRRAGSTTSSSSLTIVEDPSPLEYYHNGSSKCNTGSNSGRPKLFGVSLDGCSRSSGKRGLQGQEPTSPSTKPRLVPQKMDLGFSLLPPSLC